MPKFLASFAGSPILRAMRTRRRAATPACPCGGAVWCGCGGPYLTTGAAGQGLRVYLPADLGAAVRGAAASSGRSPEDEARAVLARALKERAREAARD